jgi:hypothetical protein
VSFSSLGDITSDFQPLEPVDYVNFNANTNIIFENNEFLFKIGTAGESDGHGLLRGQKLVYSSNSNSTIPGLNNEQTYYVDVEDFNRFGLYYDRHLVTDLVRYQINVICSKKSAHQIAIEEFDLLDDLMKDFIQSENDRQESGLVINFVRLTTPRLPASIEKNYLALVEEITMKKVLEEKKECIKTEKELELIVKKKDNVIIIANSEKTNKIMILNMISKRKKQRIQNLMIIESARTNAMIWLIIFIIILLIVALIQVVYL